MASPWLKFYPTDWQSDPALRMCSLAARGLWQEMLCIMHKAVPYGSLVVNGKQIAPKQLAVLCGAPAREVEACLAELDVAGVYSKDADGTIYSRRMRRDYEKGERDKTNGGRGGNPKLKPTSSAGVNPSRHKKHERGLTPPLTHPPPGGDNAQSQKPESESDSEVQTEQQPLSSGPRANESKSLLSPDALNLAEELWQTAGFSKETLPSGWCGSPLKIQQFIADGCPVEVIRFAVESVLKRKRPENFAYFEPAIATAFAHHKRPLPQVSIANPQPIEVRNGRSHRPPSWAELAVESIQATRSDFETEAGADRPGSGDPVIELDAVSERK